MHSPIDELDFPAAPPPIRRNPYLLAGAAPHNQLGVKDLWNTIFRRKSLVGLTILAFVGAAFLFCTLATRRYQTIGTVQVQRETSDALNLNDMVGNADTASDALEASITMQTQAAVLQSNSLALRVIRDLNLEQTEDFRSTPSGLGAFFSKFSSDGPSDPPNALLEDSPVRRAALLRTFSKNLKVQALAGTRLIEIRYSNPDPKLSAAVVNHLVQALIDYNFRVRYDATEMAAKWLGKQLSDLRKQSEQLQTKVARLQRESGVYTSGEIDQEGREQVYAPVLDRLQQATATVAQAESGRILKGALYEVVKHGSPELISGLAGTGMVANAAPGLATSLTLIQNLRAQEAMAQAQYNELAAKFGPGYPKLSELRANLEGIQRSIQAELTRLGARVKNDYAVAQQVENSARKVFDTQKRQAEALNNRTIEYQIARQEAAQSSSLYDSLLRRLKEAGLVAGLRSSNISVVDPAYVDYKHYKPYTPLFLLIGLGGGLFLGLCLALLRDTWDTKIYDVPALEFSWGGAPVGMLPKHRPDRSIWKLPSGAHSSIDRPALAKPPAEAAAVLEPQASYTEALRSLRTLLIFGTEGGPIPQVLLVTSSESGEGKSMLSMNLAALLAQQPGRKVLLVDADFRRAALGQRFDIQGEQGFSSILSNGENGKPDSIKAIAVEGVSGLHIMPSGPIPDHPAELLLSEKLAETVRSWREDYDFVVIDGAPVLPVTDSVVLSRHADLTLLVARYSRTEMQSLERSYRILQSQGTRRVNVVLNAVPSSATTYLRYFGSNPSTYYRRRTNA